MSRRRHALKLAFLTAALGLVALCLVALACAPAAPAPSASAPTPTPTVRWLGDTPSPSELATSEAIPTATPYPPGYIKPTDLPTYTPQPSEPTIVARLQTAEAQMQTVVAQTRPAVAGGVTGASGSGRDGNAEALGQIARHIALQEYYAIVKVRVISTRLVPVPDIAAEPPWTGEKAHRDTVEVITTYRGSISKRFDLISHAENQALDVGREYILSVYQYWVLESEYPPEHKLFPFTPETLKAAGGRTYSYDVGMIWVIDAGLAMYVPSAYTVWGRGGYGSHLEAGRDSYINLPLPAIEAAIRP